MTPEVNAEVLAERLRYLRTDILGLTVEEFCRRADINVNTYYNYLHQKHRARYRVVHDICQTFGVPEGWLMGLKEEM